MNLWNNIIIAGINTMDEGIVNRLEKEIYNIRTNNYRIKIVAPPEREFSDWIGGSILSSLSTFEELWFTKEKYKELGAKGVHSICSY